MRARIMGGHSRRDFLRFSATLAGAASATAMLPASIRKAMAIAPQGRTGSIEDVEHIVVFMQENRSFDHYLGHLSGVRGYNDRFPVTLPNGRPVWFQPRQEDASALIAPFRYDTTDPAMNAQCVGSLSHTWATTHGALNAGRADQWAQQKSNMCMGYHVREDIPFHYALADAFTVCDQYFCSIPGNTHPNRMYLMTGMVDPLGTGGGPLLDNTDYIDNQFSDVKLPPFTWTTYPERLERAGISWQVYQQGTDFDKFSGNYGTNMLASFENFVHAPIGSSLYERGMSTRTVAQLKADVEQGALPQVSWLLPPAVYSEHPDYTPLYGASYLSDILDALTANPEVWSKTVLFVMYDENDGFFDHIVPPQAPTLPGSGKSTVDIALERHVYVTPRQQDQFSADQLPYGLGPRVPMFVVSPWSRGGRVNSQVFDHTSVLQFIERRFGVKEPNISPWRRAVCGDLSSTLDFTRRDASPPRLPDTRRYVAEADQQCRRPVAISAPALGCGAEHHAPGAGSAPDLCLALCAACERLARCARLYPDAGQCRHPRRAFLGLYRCPRRSCCRCRPARLHRGSRQAIARRLGSVSRGLLPPQRLGTERLFPPLRGAGCRGQLCRAGPAHPLRCRHRRAHGDLAQPWHHALDGHRQRPGLWPAGAHRAGIAGAEREQPLGAGRQPSLVRPAMAHRRSAALAAPPGRPSGNRPPQHERPGRHGTGDHGDLSAPSCLEALTRC
ncbi:phosphocholine-specific phospholipase C [Herbaspirillum rubrisubalbicans]|nr:phosphocholine-specific phospholipase C [Herbaspirillum rubrisubalbicans]